MDQRTAPIMGVYRITCTVTGKFYIGSSSNVKNRLSKHRSSLRAGRHVALAMQADWDEHGEGFFEFSIVETVSALNEIAACEQRHLDEHRPFDPATGYNRATRTDGAGWRFTDEQRKRLAAALRGKPKSAEHRSRIWANRQVTPEHRARMSAIGKSSGGIPKTAEHNRKNADAQRGSLNHYAKLTEVDVAEIRRRLAGGAKGAHLAVEFGVSQPTISNIKNGKIWPHVAAAAGEPVVP